LLTIFFMLVTRFSSAEQTPMQLPKPDQSVAELTRMTDRVIINCTLTDPALGPQGGVMFAIGANPRETLGAISDRLANVKSLRPNIKVIIRADRRLPYTDVRSLMAILARHGIELLNVVAHVGEGN
jgi:biopolymer transport protein ExbD